MAFDTSPDEPVNDLDRFSRDFTRLQQQKRRKHGGVEGRTLTNLCFYYGEHYVTQEPSMVVQRGLDPNKLSLVFNLIKKHVRKRTGRLIAPNMRFGASPSKDDPRSRAQAEVVDDLILALDDKVSQSMRAWEIIFWLLMGGVAVERTPWVPDVSTEPLPRVNPDTGEFLWTDTQAPDPANATLTDAMVDLAIKTLGRAPESFTLQEDLRRVGDVGSIIHGPLSVFVDASVRDLRSLGPDQRVYTAEIKTLEWIAEQFGTDAATDARGSDLSVVQTRLKQMGPTLGGTDLADLIPAIQGTQGHDDPEMALVVTGYEPPSAHFPTGREIFFVPDRVMLDDRPNPYEEVPLTDYHYDPAATSFWSTDYVSDLIPGNKFLNKRMSQLGEQANASIYDLILLGPDLTAKSIPSDKPGLVLDGIDEAGNLMVARLPGPSLPGWFLETIKLTIDFIEQAGGVDLMSSKRGTGQLRGPLAIPMLQELLDSEDAPLFGHLGERFARAKQMRVNRVKQFYPAVRTLNYTGRAMRDEVLTFHASKTLRAGTEFNIRVDRRSLMPELSALREARVRERMNGPLSILYLDPQTNQPDISKIAEDLDGYDPVRESKATQGRKFAQEIISRLWRAEPVEPPMPFYPHRIFMDEFESAMMSSEWHTASPQVKNLFVQQWNLHRDFLQQQADQMAKASEQIQIQSAVAQATQMVAAKTAAVTAEAALGQVDANLGETQGLEAQLTTLLSGGGEATAGDPRQLLGRGQVAPTPDPIA